MGHFTKKWTGILSKFLKTLYFTILAQIFSLLEMIPFLNMPKTVAPRWRCTCMLCFPPVVSYQLSLFLKMDDKLHRHLSCDIFPSKQTSDPMCFRNSNSVRNIRRILISRFYSLAIYNFTWCHKSTVNGFLLWRRALLLQYSPIFSISTHLFSMVVY